MSFIKDLKHLRSAGLVNAGPAGPVDADKAKVDGAGQVQPGKEPELRGGQGKPVAKKAQGLSGAALRTTIGDLFAAADKLGIPGPVIAKYAGHMDQNVAAMKDAAARIDKSLAAIEDPTTKAAARGLTSQLVQTVSRGFNGLDQTSIGNQIRQTIETSAEVLEGPRKITGMHIRALETLARAAAQLNSGDVAAELRRGSKQVLGKNDAIALQAALASLDGAMPTFVSASDGPARTQLFRAALEAAMIAAHEVAKPVEEVIATAIQNTKAQLTEGQLELLNGFAGAVREHKAALEQHDVEAKAQAQELSGQYQQQLEGPSADKLAPLADLRARADQLPAYQRGAWYAQVNGYVGQEAHAVSALAKIHLELLEHAGGPTPNAEVLNQLSQSAIALASIPGVTAEMITRFAEDHVRMQSPERLPGMLATLNSVAGELGQRGVQLKDAGDLATLANSLIGRTDGFADQAKRALLVDLLQQTAEGPARAQALEHGARMMTAVAAMEPGPARDAVIARQAADLGALAAANLDYAGLASAYRLVPEEMLPRFVATAAHHQLDPDKWLLELSDMFKAARGNKEHVRSIRTLLTLAEQADGDVVKLARGLLAAKMNGPQLTRTINAVLNENNHQITKESIDNVIGMLGRGENVASKIEAKLHADMVAKLGLDALLKDANIKVTEKGFEIVSNSLRQFFSSGLQNAQLDKEMFKQLLISVLEDRFDSFRFTTKPAETQLACLTSTQRRLWEEGSVMTHVRFDGNGQVEFDKRVTAASAIAKGLVERLTEAWGPLADLKAKHADIVKRLREVDKNDRPARQAIIGELGFLPAQISALEWAQELAEMSPATTTPLRFAEMADHIPTVARMLGDAGAAALNELSWTVRIDDLSYSQVMTYDRLDLAAMYKAVGIGTGCINHWPQKLDLLAYCIDPNKRMVLTKNQAGEIRRAVVRLVERQDEGHIGQPMLILERTYPDDCTQEEKQRIIEHMLRRATEMGIAAGFATEYYWDSAKTGRRIMDMNVVLEDLNRRYDTTSQKLDIKVMNRAGNMPSEYLDSAPTARNMRGQVGARYYPGNQDTIFENEFVVLEPQK